MKPHMHSSDEITPCGQYTCIHLFMLFPSLEFLTLGIMKDITNWCISGAAVKYLDGGVMVTSLDGGILLCHHQFMV